MLITLELTEQEAEHLAQLLDIATKAGGMQVAKVAVPLMDKLMASVKESAEESTVD